MQHVDDLELAAMGVKKRKQRPWGWFLSGLLFIAGGTFVLSFYVPLKGSYEALLSEHEKVAKKARELDDALVASKTALDSTEQKRASLQKVADERTGAESAASEKTSATLAVIEKSLGKKSDQIALTNKQGRIIVAIDPSRLFLPVAGKLSPAATKSLCPVGGVVENDKSLALRVVVPVAADAKSEDWADASKGAAGLVDALISRCKVDGSRLRAEVTVSGEANARVLLVVAAAEGDSTLQ
jgi:hypothetical protein